MDRSNKWIAVGILILNIMGCSDVEEPLQTVVKGRITVADSIDQSGDYSGISIFVFQKDSVNANADTLFFAETDSAGYFQNTAIFEEEGFYPMLISRNQNNLGSRQVILSHFDTLEITGQLPNLDRTLALQSHQHNALKVYKRVNRQFGRVAQFAQRGGISQDSLVIELKKWGNLFWEVYERFPATFAGQLAAAKSLDITWNLDYETAMDKIERLAGKEKSLGIAASYGTRVIADSAGLTPTVQFLDSLIALSETEEVRRQIIRSKIQLFYDSAKVDEARAALAEFRKNFVLNKEARNWAKHIGYDLEHLAPGDTLPPFSFTTLDSSKVTRDSLRGSPFILEISAMANDTYQQQFDRTLVLKQLFQKTGLQIVTIPLDASPVTVDAFFEARGGVPWIVAAVESVDRGKVLETYNVNQTPVRFLVDQEGLIVKKMVGNEYQNVIQYIQQIISKKEELP